MGYFATETIAKKLFLFDKIIYLLISHLVSVNVSLFLRFCWHLTNCNITKKIQIDKGNMRKY